MSYIRLRDRLRIPTYDNVKYVTTGTVTFDHEKCNGCGMCVKICPGRALLLKGEGKGKKAYMLDDEITPCLSCNCCAAICSKDAVLSRVYFDFNYYYKVIHRGEFNAPRKFI